MEPCYIVVDRDEIKMKGGMQLLFKEEHFKDIFRSESTYFAMLEQRAGIGNIFLIRF